MLIIGITGKKQSGKNTFTDILHDHLTARAPFLNIQEIAFADSLKDAAATALGVTRLLFDDNSTKSWTIPSYNVTPRFVMQTLGDWGRDIIDPNIWITRLEKDIDPSADVVIITDVRFENEADLVRKHEGILLHIHREGLEQDDHVSERGVKKQLQDCSIHNNGTVDDLRGEASAIADYLVTRLHACKEQDRWITS